MSNFSVPAKSQHQFSASREHHQVGVFLNKSGNHVGLIYVKVSQQDVEGCATSETDDDDDDIVTAADIDEDKVQETWVLSLLNENILEHELRDIPNYTKQFFFAPCPLDYANAIGFASVLNVVGRNQCRNIRFGLDWHGSLGSFTFDGRYTPPEKSLGLTCASFVSELFAARKLPIVKPETWEKDTPSNKEWRDKKIDAWNGVETTRNAIGEQKIAAHASLTPLMRLLPTEAAAAAEQKIASSPPLDSASASALAAKLLAEFEVAYPPPKKKG
jgi:hypothetical protein